MGVYIKGMEMPKSCYDCPIRKRNGMKIQCPVCGETFSVADVNILFYRLKNCPIGELPPHGRLIDADALINTIEQHDKHLKISRYDRDLLLHYLDVEMAHTIIEAESAE